MLGKTVCMSLISASRRHRSSPAGFTLVEVIVAVALSAIIFAGILSGYTFLARNFTRLLNTQGQDTKSRKAVYIFSQDISKAVQVASAADTHLTLLLPVSGGTTSSVSYDYNSTDGTLTRTDSSSSVVLLSNLTYLDFNYFNKAGGAVTSGPLSVKEVEVSFSTALGTASNGTQSRYTAVSPRLVLRNKPLLQ